LDPGHRNEKVSAVWQQNLKSGDAHEIALTLDVLNSAQASASLDIDWLPFVLHDDEKVQYQARKALNYISYNRPDKASQLATALQQVVEDKDRDNDRIAAIRGLAALMGVARDATPALNNLMTDRNQPLPVRVAALNAIVRITGSDDFKMKLFDAVRGENQDRQNTPEFRKEIRQLEQAIETEARAVP
jgi:hypothetical protein